MKHRRPDPSEHAPYFSRYIDLVPETDVCSALEAQSMETARYLAGIEESQAGYRYAPGKWSIRELIGHVSDSERVFAYRMLAIGRGEKKPLPGFDENDYNRNAAFDQWRLAELAENLALVRRTTLLLLRHLPDDAWDRQGVANNNPVTVRAVAFTALGHERHHLGVLRERYEAGARTT